MYYSDVFVYVCIYIVSGNMTHACWQACDAVGVKQNIQLVKKTFCMLVCFHFFILDVY